MQPRRELIPRDLPQVIATIEIDDEAYRLTRQQARPGCKAFRLRKLEGQREGAAYLVEQFASGAQRCDCPDAVYRRRQCKHLLALQILGALDTPEAEPIKEVSQP